MQIAGLLAVNTEGMQRPGSPDQVVGAGDRVIDLHTGQNRAGSHKHRNGVEADVRLPEAGTGICAAVKEVNPLPLRNVEAPANRPRSVVEDRHHQDV